MNYEQNPDREIQPALMNLSVLLNEGKFQEVIEGARSLLPKTKVSLNRASCHFMLGCAMNELDDSSLGLANILESLFMFPPNEAALCGNAQYELAQIQFNRSFLSSAHFFIELAISNFELLPTTGANIAFIEECKKLKQQIEAKQVAVR